MAKKVFITWSVYSILPLNTIVELPDGRIGTICYNHLDGQGGVFGEQQCTMEELPKIEFMLRDPYDGQTPDTEYVGAEYKLVGEQLDQLEKGQNDRSI